MIISPSILAADFLSLKSEITAFDGVDKLQFHLDLMDGHYVPNLSFGKVVMQNIKNITNHKLDAHLMVTNPEFYVEDLKDIGLYNLTFHWEACTHHDSLINNIKKYYQSVGVSLNPATSETIIPLSILKKIDLILIMSVNPGFGGQSFIDDSIDKVKYFSEIKKKHGLKLEIQVDGGVTNQNSKHLIDAGATNLVAGSYIFKSNRDEYKEKVESLR